MDEAVLETAPAQDPKVDAEMEELKRQVEDALLLADKSRLEVVELKTEWVARLEKLTAETDHMRLQVERARDESAEKSERIDHLISLTSGQAGEVQVLQQTLELMAKEYTNYRAQVAAEMQAVNQQRELAVYALNYRLEELVYEQMTVVVDYLGLPWDGPGALPKQLKEVRARMDKMGISVADVTALAEVAIKG